ncbi:Crp/Fnr family transcriptional regulator [Allosalinactinospora lopnorensis]|uniref:Crp/Fnr family transcriptional regulator n=1 Tax=Allosalinactinospora lopnorensis TaxID=1352348 RepID=UPI0009E52D55|nr:Crp/Fnr family transcriptional regulator [Allosalinactinospora lopnorensis]
MSESHFSADDIVLLYEVLERLQAESPDPVRAETLSALSCVRDAADHGEPVDSEAQQSALTALQRYLSLVNESSLGTAGARAMKRRALSAHVSAILQAAHKPDEHRRTSPQGGRGVGGGGRRPWPAKSVIASLKPDQCRALLALGHLRHFAAEDVLVHQGERTRHVFVLIDGVTKVTHSSRNGRRVLLAIRSRGDLIGELASLDGSPRIATVTATGLVSAVVIAHRDFEAFLAKNPEVSQAVSASIAGKFHSTTQRVIDYSAHDVPVRLARVLYQLYQDYGLRKGDRVELGIPITPPELASIIGASEVTVQKALADLRQRRIASTGYRTNAITSFAALAETADINDQ